MRKSRAAEVIASQTGVAIGRIQSIAQRLSDAGILPKASGQNRPNLTHDQMARLLIAVLADNGLGNVERSVTVFASVHSEALGLSLVDFLSGYLEGATVTPGVMVRSLIVRNDLDCPGASVILSTEAGAFHATFGAEASEAGASKHAILSGAALDAIATAFRLAQVGR